MSKKMMRRLEMVVWGDWRLAFWIHWLHLRFLLGDMELDTNMVFSNKSLKMDISVKFLIFG